ncbi:MAG: hypothetical protein EOQ55_27170 [Mesorhizobium sp.]|uniref:hypothetical protein n=1 Tax=Mesorhizobium sp. TaxID=1871066 RepID=UPI000FE64DDE|nr:hypothetical protein [Mesorhizobium sp.]RWG12237.1 MAG: hypothetical protein EOQ55_27170 [Mesorhizobium sp.]
MKTRRVPAVMLDGEFVMQPIFEARDGEFGYVVVGLLDADSKPILANVVLPNGEVIDQVIAKKTLRGNVEIIFLPDLLV